MESNETEELQQPASIFTKEEEASLNDLKAKRMLMINNRFKDDIPADNKSLEIINQLISSQETAIIKTAEIRVKQAATRSQGEMKEIIAGIFKERAAQAAKQVARANPTATLDDVAEELETPEFVKGETSLLGEQLDFKEIMGEEYNG